MLLLTLFSDDAFTFTLKLCTSLSLIPYLLAAGYALRISPGRHRELIIALLATVYTAFLVIAAGIEYVLLSCIVYAPGTLLFVRARREQEATVFTAVEKGLVVVVVAGAAVGVAALATGWITI